MRDRLIELTKASLIRHIDKTCKLAENIADDLLENGVVALPCKIGQTVYKIEPLWYETFGVDVTEHKCFNCEHFYEGGYGDPADCGLGKNCCYHIVEKEANLRRIGDWLTPNIFTEKIEWGKTVFLTREQAEKALAEVANGT